MFYAIWYHLYNLKNVKYTHEGVLRSYTPQWCFSRFLNYIQGTKSRNASHINIYCVKYARTRAFSWLVSLVIRKKGESQNGCFKKTMHAKLSEKRTFLTPWYAHVLFRRFALLPTVFPNEKMRVGENLYSGIFYGIMFYNLVPFSETLS